MRYARPIIVGLLVVAAGLLPWLLLAPHNARVRSDVPWAALVSLALLAVLIGWLNGWGPPARSAERRRRRLRLWPPTNRRDADAGSLPAWSLVLALVLLTGAWIAVGRLSPVPDLAAYPTTSYRWSAFLMGGLLSGIVEEAAYRGYMQTGLERIDPANAVWITSLVFAASHVVHGIGAMILLGPGLFLAGLLYGELAARTGTILPGMIIHVLGDLAHTFFGVLRGDPGLLFVS